MSPRVGLINIADRFYTGSSTMPRRKDPDIPELARGRMGRVNGHLIDLLILAESQPLTYDKDNQEDKEPLFDTVDTVVNTLRVFADMVPGVAVKIDAMCVAALQSYAIVIDLADHLVKHGLPFRDAHGAVTHAVRACDGLHCNLASLPAAQLYSICGPGDRVNLIDDDVHTVPTLEGSIALRNRIGGTTPE